MTINILLKATREQQIEIEEHCLNFGTSISDYLLGLHAVNMTYKNRIEQIEKTPMETIEQIYKRDEEIKPKIEIENADNSKKSKKKA